MDVRGVIYDTDAYGQACERFAHAPRELTIADVKQLTLVDPEIGTEARASNSAGWTGTT